nr:hypothetical protein [uncultured Achromobacter sp.]
MMDDDLPSTRMSSHPDYDVLHENRMKRLEADEAAAKKMGFNQKYMHLSALSPTTRKSHAARHGQLFTANEVRQFWSDKENVAGCKCTAVAVMLDKSGKPLLPIIIETAKASLAAMSARGYDWSK